MQRGLAEVPERREHAQQHDGDQHAHGDQQRRFDALGKPRDLVPNTDSRQLDEAARLLRQGLPAAGDDAICTRARDGGMLPPSLLDYVEGQLAQLNR